MVKYGMDRRRNSELSIRRDQVINVKNAGSRLCGDWNVQETGAA